MFVNSGKNMDIYHVDDNLINSVDPDPDQLASSEAS